MSKLAHKIKAAILISSRGSNMEALIHASQDPKFPVSFVCIGSNKADAKGLDFAHNNHIKTFVLNPKDFANRQEYDEALHQELIAHNIQLIVLAGFMRLLTPWLCEQWANKMLNIHPSLLPAYKGLDTHERALSDGAKVHGCTVHFVTAGMDEGPIIGQSQLEVSPSDTAQTLAAKVLKLEHQLYPKMVEKIALKMLSEQNN